MSSPSDATKYQCHAVHSYSCHEAPPTPSATQEMVSVALSGPSTRRGSPLTSGNLPPSSTTPEARPTATHGPSSTGAMTRPSTTRVERIEGEGQRPQTARRLAIACSAGAVVVAFEATRQVTAAEDAAGRGRPRQRIGGKDHRRARPRSALLRPPLAVGENQASPIGPVLFSQVMHRRELFVCPGRVADGVQCHYQLAGFGAGDPWPVVDAADAEARDDKVVPSVVDS